MLAVGQQQQQQPVGLAWLLPALGTAATASCQLVCPAWASSLASQVQPTASKASQHPQRAGMTAPTAVYPQLLPNPGWLAGLPPLFAPPSQEVHDLPPADGSIPCSQSQRKRGEAGHPHLPSGQQEQLFKHTSAGPEDAFPQDDGAGSLDSSDSLSEGSFTEGDQSDSYPSSQGSQQTSSSALEALLAVADTCSNTGCLTPTEALEVARQRYELARGRLQGRRRKSPGDSFRRSRDCSPSARASCRRPGACVSVSKLTAQQRRARHRCNNPWSIGETQALLEGIERCGVGKWADIQRLRLPAIIKRSPVDLKDKWRNLSRLAQDPNTGRANNTVPRHFLSQVRQILGLQC